MDQEGEKASVVDQLNKLRKPFLPNQINQLPKPYKKDSPKGKCDVCGGYHGLPAVHLDYVGHAALTDRLLDVDPFWNWEPMSVDADNLPQLDKQGGLWIKLTVCGVIRLGYGDAQGKTGTNAMKERIGDALRNAAMRFGGALDLWHKGELHETEEPPKPPPKPIEKVTAEQINSIEEYLIDDPERLSNIKNNYKISLLSELSKGQGKFILKTLESEKTK